MHRDCGELVREARLAGLLTPDDDAPGVSRRPQVAGVLVAALEDEAHAVDQNQGRTRFADVVRVDQERVVAESPYRDRGLRIIILEP